MNAKDKDEISGLMEASIMGHVAVVKELLKVTKADGMGLDYFYMRVRARSCNTSRTTANVLVVSRQYEKQPTTARKGGGNVSRACRNQFFLCVFVFCPSVLVSFSTSFCGFWSKYMVVFLVFIYRPVFRRRLEARRSAAWPPALPSKHPALTEPPS